MAKLSPELQTSREFLRLLAKGKPVAMEDATRRVSYPAGYDKRSLGGIVRQMQLEGRIVEAGFRRAKSSTCNSGIKRLWIATELLTNSREGESRG